MLPPSFSLSHTHTQTHTPCIPLYPLCRPPRHHKITASDREIRNPLLLSFTLIKVSNSLPNSTGSARQSYGNFGSANSWSQKDRHCFCGVGVFAIIISIYADPELMCCPVMYHQAYNAAWLWFVLAPYNRCTKYILLRSYSTALLISCMVKSFLNIILKITQDYNFSKLKQYRLVG